jgi:hypothetical protein
MELSAQNAKDIDDILKLAVERGLLNGFDIGYYQSTIHPDLDKSYLYYLAGLMASYMKEYGRNWITLDHGRIFTCNNNTKGFLESGGFQKIYNDEKMQELKDEIELNLARKTLKDYPFTKWIAWIGFLIAFGLAILEIAKQLSAD